MDWATRYCGTGHYSMDLLPIAPSPTTPAPAPRALLASPSLRAAGRRVLAATMRSLEYDWMLLRVGPRTAGNCMSDPSIPLVRP